MQQPPFSPLPASLARALAGLPALPPIPMGSIQEFDGVDTHYRFDVYGILARPGGWNAVYVFAEQTLNGYRPLYIGKAESLSSRLDGHDRLEEARRLGASHLLIHIPGYADRVAYTEAERRLIRRFAPPLNTQHNPFR